MFQCNSWLCCVLFIADIGSKTFVIVRKLAWRHARSFQDICCLEGNGKYFNLKHFKSYFSMPFCRIMLMFMDPIIIINRKIYRNDSICWCSIAIS